MYFTKQRGSKPNRRMASYDLTYDKDLGLSKGLQQTDTDSEWVIVDVQHEGNESINIPSAISHDGSSSSAQVLKPTHKNTTRCGAVRDIEDSESASKKKEKCSQCHECVSKLPTSNQSTSAKCHKSTIEDFLYKFENRLSEHCKYAFPPVPDDPIAHLQKLTDILRNVNRLLAIKFGEVVKREYRNWSHRS